MREKLEDLLTYGLIVFLLLGALASIVVSVLKLFGLA